MDMREDIGRDIIENTLNRILQVYAGPLRNRDHPLHQNELLGPILGKLENVDPHALLELIEHSSVMLMHAFLDHLTKFHSADSGYSFEIKIVRENGDTTSLLDYFEDPGVDLVDEDGWADRFSKLP